MKIKAVFFDMGGTIDTFCYTPDLRRSRTPGIQEILQKGAIELDLGNEELYRVVSAGLERYKEWSLDSEEELPPLRVWEEFILPDFDVDHPLLSRIAEDLMCYIETSYYERNLRPEIPAVLQQVQDRGYKIGLISNVNSRGQVPINLTEYQIIRYFDPIVLSSEFGRRKPDPAIFHRAATLAGVPTSACLFVGDRLSRDILGARRAGFRLAVQIVNTDLPEECTVQVKPDYTITDMTQLLGILDSCTESSGSQLLPTGNSRAVKAIIFDAGDILYYRSQKGLYFQRFLESLNKTPRPNLESAIDRIRQQAFRGEIPQLEYHLAILNAYDINDPENIERGLAAIRQDEDNVSFTKDARQTLLTLKDSGYLLGIVTDTANPIHVKLGWFERGGFGHVWDAIITSADIGVRKPDPRIYQAALQQLGAAADEVLFLGHKATEIAGAREQGMITATFNSDQDAAADYHLSELSDLLRLPIIAIYEDSIPG